MTVLKSIVACLALANLLYFLWTHGVGEPQDEPAASAAPSRTLNRASESAVPAPAGPDASAPDASAPDAAAPDAAASGSAAPESSGLPASGGAGGAADPPKAGVQSSVKRCVTVGPFRDAGQAAHAAATLHAGGFDPRPRAVGSVYWIDVAMKTTEGFPNPAELEGGAARTSRLEVKACPADTTLAGAGAAP